MRTIYEPDAASRDSALGIEQGGTGATSVEKAIQNLGVLTESMLGVQSGVPRLTLLGKIAADDLPEGLAMLSAPSVMGASAVFKGRTEKYIITNFDMSEDYFINFSAGSFTRDADVITYTTPVTAQEVTLVINGFSYSIEVQEEIIVKPVILYPIASDALGLQNPMFFQTSAFQTNVPGGEHVSTTWEIATDVNFTSKVVEVVESVTHLTTYPAAGLLEGTVYYARVRYYGEEQGISEWSDVVQFRMVDLQRSYTQPGTYTLTIPEGIAAVDSVAVGGGGGGGAGNRFIGTVVNSKAGGGGGSGSSDSKRTLVSQGDVISVTVGNGGNRGSYYYTREDNPETGSWVPVYIYNDYSTSATAGQMSSVRLNGTTISQAPGGNPGLNGFDGIVGYGGSSVNGEAGQSGGTAGAPGGRGGNSLLGTGGAGGVGGESGQPGQNGNLGGGGGGSQTISAPNVATYGGYGGSGVVNLTLIPLVDIQPVAPTVSSASVGVPGFGLTASFATSAYQSPTSDAHESTDWELSTSPTFSTLAQSYYDDIVNLTSRTFTGLVSGTTYYLRARHNHAQALGAWSTPVSFTAVANEIEYGSPGSYSLTIPAGIESIDIQQLIAGGGMGGDGGTYTVQVQSDVFFYYGQSGGGGGGSGAKSSTAVPVTAGDLIAINIGSGGTSSSRDGGNSTISKNGTVILTQLGALRGNNPPTNSGANGTGAVARDGGSAGGNGGTNVGGAGGVGVLTSSGNKGFGGNGGFQNVDSQGHLNSHALATPGGSGYAKIKLNPIPIMLFDGQAQRRHWNGTVFSETSVNPSYLQANTHVIGCSASADETYRLSGVRLSATEKDKLKIDIVSTEGGVQGGSWTVNVSDGMAPVLVASNGLFARSWYGSDYLVSIGLVSYSKTNKTITIDLGYNDDGTTVVKGTTRFIVPFL